MWQAGGGAHPLPCPLQVTAEDLPDLLLATFGQLRQGSFHRLSRRRLLGLNVPNRKNTKLGNMEIVAKS